MLFIMQASERSMPPVKKPKAARRKPAKKKAVPPTFYRRVANQTARGYNTSVWATGRAVDHASTMIKGALLISSVIFFVHLAVLFFADTALMKDIEKHKTFQRIKQPLKDVVVAAQSVLLLFALFWLIRLSHMAGVQYTSATRYVASTIESMKAEQRRRNEEMKNVMFIFLILSLLVASVIDKAQNTFRKEAQ